MAKLPSHRRLGDIIVGTVEKGYGFSQAFHIWLDTLRQAIDAENSIPTGTLRTTLSSAEPEGWKLLNGQALDKTQFKDLHAIVGNTFGETAAAFNLPNMANRVLIGAGSVSLAEYGGSNEITLTAGNLPSHTHTVNDAGHGHTFSGLPHTHTVTDPGHTHTSGTAGGTTGESGSSEVAAASGNTGSATTGITVDSATAGGTVEDSTTGITINATGDGDPFDYVPASLGVNVLIKT